MGTSGCGDASRFPHAPMHPLRPCAGSRRLRQHVVDRREEPRAAQRLREERVHAGGRAPIAIFRHGMRGHRDHRRALSRHALQLCRRRAGGWPASARRRTRRCRSRRRGVRRSRSAPPGPTPSRGRTDRGNVEDLIDQLSDSDGRVFHANYGSANSTGVEVEAEHRSAGGILTRGSLVFQRAFDEKTGERLSNAPATLATLSFAAPIAARQVTLALDSRFVGPRLTVARHSLDSVVLADLMPRGSRDRSRSPSRPASTTSSIASSPIRSAPSSSRNPSLRTAAPRPSRSAFGSNAAVFHSANNGPADQLPPRLRRSAEASERRRSRALLPSIVKA